MFVFFHKKYLICHDKIGNMIVNDIQEVIFKILTTVSSTFFIGGAILLFLRGRSNKSRRMLAYTMLLWGIVFIIDMIQSFFHINTASVSILNVENLTIGNFLVISLFLFPLEVVIPGWLSKKRTFLLYLPFIGVTLIYCLVMLIMYEKPLNILTYSMFAENIGKFDVWYRFIMLLSILVYGYILFRMLYRYENRYVKWKNDNYSDVEYMDISWMRYYTVSMNIMFILYLLILFDGSYVTFLIYNIFVIIAFAYIFYKGLFHESPYPENFFLDTMDEGEIRKSEDPVLLNVEADEEISDTPFESKIPSYVEILNNWMKTEKPYLYKDFKLTDVSRILPLNRSYLSRIFNEGLGQSFSDVVRGYRIDYSKKLLLDHPDLSISRISEICGFSSNSTYERTFVKTEGITPKQYRIKNGTKNT